MATYAYRHRDVWDPDETRDYWLAHMPLWPRPKGQRDVTEAHALVIASAASLGLSPSEAAAATGLDVNDLRDRGILDHARDLREALGRGPGAAVMVPRVLTESEYFARDRVPLHVFSVLSAEEQRTAGPGGDDPVSDAARDAVMRGDRNTNDALQTQTRKTPTRDD